MSAIPRPLARRLDRLARRAHAFHRYAHHPLCQPYAGEVVRLGRRVRLCRGCALVILGASAGALLALAVPAPPPAALAGLAALAGALGAALEHVPVRRPAAARRPRPPKAVTRLLPGAAMAALGALGLRAAAAGAWFAGAAAGLAALLVLAAGWRRYRRRSPDRSACLACPEREGRAVCTGFRPIARREAAFRRRAGRLLASAVRSSPLTLPREG